MKRSCGEARDDEKKGAAKPTTPSTRSIRTGSVHDDDEDNEQEAAATEYAAANTTTVPGHCSTNNNNKTNLHSPHTLRLLRIIQEGSSDQAQMATARLLLLLQQQQLQQQQQRVWDILGRLALTACRSMEWRTRRQAALALESLAGQLLLSLVRQADDHQEEQVVDYQYLFSNVNNDGGSSSSSTSYLYLLSMDDLEQHVDTVLSRGRCLWGHGSDDDDEPDDNDDASAQVTLQKRLQQQQRILTERLGLATIQSIVTTSTTTSSGHSRHSSSPIVLAQEDLLCCTSTLAAKRRRREHHAEALRKRQRQNQQIATKANDKNDEDDDDTHLDPICRLLLRVVQKHQQGNNASNSQRDAQTLLANELSHRILASSWQVRHGALLATLAILKAWKPTTTGQWDGGGGRFKKNTNFGTWPMDILVKCLCVLALDRFGDFSGALLLHDTANGDAASSAPTATTATASAVVAPVREAAGQVLSVLLYVFEPPPDIRYRTLRILLSVLLNHTAEWEVRHGALVALKYIVALLCKTDKFDNESNSDETALREDVLKSIIPAVMSHLKDDPSEDCKAVAAQILAVHVSHIGNVKDGQHPDMAFLMTLSSHVWHVLCDCGRTNRLSSCLVDIVALFRVLVQQGVRITFPVDQDVTRVLVSLLESDFPSVQVSILACIPSLAATLVARKEGKTAVGLMERIFETYQQNPPPSPLSLYSAVTAESDAACLVPMRDAAWDALVKAISSKPQNCNNTGILLTLQRNLLLRFFDIRATMISSSSADCSFTSSLSSAQALGRLLLASSRDSVVSPFRLISIFSHLQSPWYNLCEAALLLIQTLAPSLSLDQQQQQHALSIQSTVQELLLKVPLCLEQDTGDSLSGTSLEQQQVCHQVFTHSIHTCTAATDWRRTVTDIIEIWRHSITANTKTVIGRLDIPGKATTTVLSMRVYATIAGTVTALASHDTLPEKLSPIVRPLMTSLKNEVQPSRVYQTCQYISQLLLKIYGIPKYGKVRDKVLDSLCEMAKEENDASIGASKQYSHDRLQPASTILSLFLRVVSSLRDIPSVWRQLERLFQSQADDENDEMLLQSVYLLRAIAHRTFSNTDRNHRLEIFHEFAEPLVRCACKTLRSDISSACQSTLSAIIATDNGPGLEEALRSILLYVKAEQSDECRKVGTMLLDNILASASSAAISPFVRSLLPPAMALMTDPVPECAKSANKVFALLVRLSPLSREEDSITLDPLWVNDEGRAVIDHLMLGKALPLCSLPSSIEDSLRKAGVILRDYQVEGICWLRFLQTMKLSGALCDAMGLGKTIQALVGIALAHCDGEKEKVSGQVSPVSLIICPSTLVGHWSMEIEKFFPGGNVLRSISLVGNSAARKVQWQNLLHSGANVLIASYAVMRSDISYLSEREWRYCVLDEGHLLKNPKTATSRASRALRSRHRLILTGTPIQNRVDELWATFDFLMPNFLGNSSAFSKEYALPIAKSQLPGSSAAVISEGMAKLKLLHQQVLPFILRREKEQVLAELPPKIVSVIYTSMSKIQRSAYQSFCSRTSAKSSLTKLQQVIQDTEDKGSSQMALGAEVLKSLLFLRLLCTHPSLVDNERRTDQGSHTVAASGKLLALMDLLRAAGITQDRFVAADNDTSLLYCTDEDQSQEEAYNTAVASTEDSGLQSTIPARSTTSCKCIIFAQFHQSLDIVEELVLRPQLESFRYLRLDSRTPVDKRTAIAERFNDDREIKVLLSTSRVGGLGLNLTGADVAIFLENDFNPFVDLQASDRIHRIGQRKVVNVYSIVTKDSIEEKIVSLQQRKVQVSNAIVNTENSTLFSMGTDRLLDVFSFGSGGDGDGEAESNGNDTQQVDLDALADRYREDYSSLSVEDFVRGFSESSGS